jgi:hypothetical protein
MTDHEKIPWKRLTVEAAAIVASILLAFSIDAWWENRSLSQDEVESLTLLQRDLNISITQLSDFSFYAESAAKAALRAYANLSADGPYDRDSIHNDLLFVDRKSLKLPNAAYTELLSTGNLRVIRNRAMRDAIINFYEYVEFNELVVEKNNDSVLDRQLQGQYYENGLLLPHLDDPLDTDILKDVYVKMNKQLGKEFKHRLDPMWSFQPDSQEWRSLRSVLLNAANNHGIGQEVAEELIVEAKKLESEIQAWLGAR